MLSFFFYPILTVFQLFYIFFHHFLGLLCAFLVLVLFFYSLETISFLPAYYPVVCLDRLDLLLLDHSARNDLYTKLQLLRKKT